MKYDVSITTFSERNPNLPYEDGQWQGVVTFDRLEGLITTIDSLLCSDLKLCKKIYISDDGSTDERAIAFLKILHRSHPKIQVTFNPDRKPETHGTSVNAYRAVMAGTEEYMVRLADDTIFNRDWLSQLNELQRKVEEDLKEEWGALSICSFRSLGAYAVGEKAADNCLRVEKIPSFAALYKRSLFEERFPSMQHLLNDRKSWSSGYHYEFGYQDLLINKGLKSFTTENSYVKSLVYPGKPTLNAGSNTTDYIENEYEY
jgi:glycosyltransferase involved in cell wall biosynthesis